MQRIRIYRVLFLLTVVLTPAVFFWEFGYPLQLSRVHEKPYAFHWVPEILCLFFWGMLVAVAGESCLNKHPQAMRKIKHALLLSTFLFGSVVLALYLLVIENLEPMAFQGFVWGLPMLLGYWLELKVFSRGWK